MWCRFECEEKSNKIQALEIECADAKIKLGTENPSMKKVLEKSKEDLVKVENQLETEAVSKKGLEESLSSYRKLRQSWRGTHFNIMKHKKIFFNTS